MASHRGDRGAGGNEQRGRAPGWGPFPLQWRAGHDTMGRMMWLVRPLRMRGRWRWKRPSSTFPVKHLKENGLPSAEVVKLADTPS